MKRTRAIARSSGALRHGAIESRQVPREPARRAPQGKHRTRRGSRAPVADQLRSGQVVQRARQERIRPSVPRPEADQPPPARPKTAQRRGGVSTRRRTRESRDGLNRVRGRHAGDPPTKADRDRRYRGGQRESSKGHGLSRAVNRLQHDRGHTLKSHHHARDREEADDRYCVRPSVSEQHRYEVTGNDDHPEHRRGDDRREEADRAQPGVANLLLVPLHARERREEDFLDRRGDARHWSEYDTRPSA